MQISTIWEKSAKREGVLWISSAKRKARDPPPVQHEEEGKSFLCHLPAIEEKGDLYLLSGENRFEEGVGKICKSPK